MVYRINRLKKQNPKLIIIDAEKVFHIKSKQTRNRKQCHKLNKDPPTQII